MPYRHGPPHPEGPPDLSEVHAVRRDNGSLRPQALAGAEAETADRLIGLYVRRQDRALVAQPSSSRIGVTRTARFLPSEPTQPSSGQ